jgi:hypothetical protein
VTQSVVFGQVESLTKLDSAKKRLDEYLVRADDKSSLRGVFIRFSRCSSKNDRTEDVSLVEGATIQIRDDKRHVCYVCNQKSNPDMPKNERSESLTLEGKVRMKAYLVGSEFDSALTFNDEEGVSDEVKEQREQVGQIGFLSSHFEIDPLGLPICCNSALNGQLSSINNAIRFWVSKTNCIKEEYSTGKLVSIWEAKPSGYRCELTFDDEQGGMPVLLRYYKATKDQRPDGNFLLENRSKWKEQEDGSWVPASIVVRNSNRASETEWVFDFEFVQTGTLKQVMSEIDWKRLFENKNASWYRDIVSIIRREEKN